MLYYFIIYYSIIIYKWYLLHILLLLNLIVIFFICIIIKVSFCMHLNIINDISIYISYYYSIIHIFIVVLMFSLFCENNVV